MGPSRPCARGAHRFPSYGSQPSRVGRTWPGGRYRRDRRRDDRGHLAELLDSPARTATRGGPLSGPSAALRRSRTLSFDMGRLAWRGQHLFGDCGKRSIAQCRHTHRHVLGNGHGFTPRPGSVAARRYPCPVSFRPHCLHPGAGIPVRTVRGEPAKGASWDGSSPRTGRHDPSSGVRAGTVGAAVHRLILLAAST